MSDTTFSGPVKAGPQKDVTGVSTDPYNQGFVRLTQVANIAFNATLVSEVLINVPPGCRIQSFDVDVLTAFDSGTSATFSAGTTSGGTTYASGVNVKAATGRIAPTYTAAQLAAMSGQSLTGTAAAIAAPGNVYLTITSVGQPTAGYVTVAVNYVQLV
jgi:hypothetical protein